MSADQNGTELQNRLQRVLEVMREAGRSHLILAPGASFTYFTSLHAHRSERLTLFGCSVDGKVALLVPKLEREMAEDAHVDNVFSYADEEGPARAVEQFVQALALNPDSQVAVEESHLRLFEAEALTHAGVQHLVSGSAIVMALRLYKTNAEVDIMARAALITDKALAKTLPLLRTGMSELEVAAELEYQLKKLGSEALPFGTIVGAGARGALPHSVPGTTVIKQGDLVVLDFGAVVEGYAADTTRTVAFGEPAPEARHVYETVRLAQAAAVQSIRPGLPVAEVDRAARSPIAAAGFGEYFTHRTGHGLGLEVHEYPSIMAGSDLTLHPGMVFTVEPGIYLSGKFGVRIEDDVLVTENGVRVLTQFTRELVVL